MSADNKVDEAAAAAAAAASVADTVEGAEGGWRGILSMSFLANIRVASSSAMLLAALARPPPDDDDAAAAAAEGEKESGVESEVVEGLPEYGEGIVPERGGEGLSGRAVGSRRINPTEPF